MSGKEIHIYSDGSCNQKENIGGWAAFILYDGREYLLKGVEYNTTHNRMELLSIIKALEYIENEKMSHHKILVFSDSQYAVGLSGRKEKLSRSNYLTKKGAPVRNRDLLEGMFYFIDSYNIMFVKVQSHRKKGPIINYNREADKMARKMVRDTVKEYNR